MKFVTKGNSASLWSLLWILSKFSLSLQALKETQLQACKIQYTHLVVLNLMIKKKHPYCFWSQMLNNQFLHFNKMWKRNTFANYYGKILLFSRSSHSDQVQKSAVTTCSSGMNHRSKTLAHKIVFWQSATAVRKLLEDASQASDPCHSPDRPPDSISFRIFPFLISSLE